MLELTDVRSRIVRFDPASLTHVWTHDDPAVDTLQRAIEHLVGRRVTAPRDDMFGLVWEIAHSSASEPAPSRAPLLSRAAVPYLNEPWYC